MAGIVKKTHESEILIKQMPRGMLFGIASIKIASYYKV